MDGFSLRLWEVWYIFVACYTACLLFSRLERWGFVEQDILGEYSFSEKGYISSVGV
jgi:hypothetical protein